MAIRSHDVSVVCINTSKQSQTTGEVITDGRRSENTSSVHTYIYNIMRLERLFWNPLGSEAVKIILAGRRTAVYNMKLSEVEKNIPTLSFDAETDDGHNIAPLDSGGRVAIRPLFKQHVLGADAILIVLDFANHQEMQKMLVVLVMLRLRRMTDDESHYPAVCILAENLHEELDEVRGKLREALIKQLDGFTNNKFFSLSLVEEGRMREPVAWLSQQIQSSLSRKMAEDTRPHSKIVSTRDKLKMLRRET
ncbi:hypothetical protein ScPMuIL_011512 [Solemya velum]